MNNEQRKKHFTSSKVFSLMKLGKRLMTTKELQLYVLENPKSKAKYCADGFAEPGLTYISEKAMEHRLDRCLDANGAYSQSMAWGKLMEIIVFEICGVEYKMVSKETALHPKYGNIWSGSADMVVPKVKISEIKCYQYKKFCEYTDCIMLQDVELLKDNYPQEYWQIVSNACIHELKRGEAISYMPFYTELEKIREIIQESNFLERNDLEPWEYRFITEKNINLLPSLPDDGYYMNLNKFEFEIPKQDIELLTSRILQAELILKDEIKLYEQPKLHNNPRLDDKQS